MQKFLKKILNRTFEITILIKSLFGFFEILGGAIIAISAEKLIDNFFIAMALNEIARDPNDFLATHFVYWSVDLYLGPKFFAIFYLVAHGVINIFLGVCLMKNKLWAYPWAMAGFGGFIINQFYEFLHTLSWTMLALTLFDVLIVGLIWWEYVNRKKRLVKLELAK